MLNNSIKKEIQKITEKSSELPNEICQMIHKEKLYDNLIYQDRYLFFKKIDFVYNFDKRIFILSDTLCNLISHKTENNTMPISDSCDFYEGFGLM